MARAKKFADRNGESLQIVVAGVGGQGVLSAAKLLGMSAGKAGYPVQSSAVHGMAQRGGMVETYVIVGERSSAIIDPGEADILLGFEPVETLRALRRGSKKTLVVSNDQPIIPFFCTLAGKDYPSPEDVFTLIRSSVKQLVVVNANRMAKEAGSELALNMVMLGVLAGSGALPFDADILRTTLEENTPARYREVNLRAFERGYGAVT